MTTPLDEFKQAFSNCTHSAARHRKIPLQQTLQALADAVQDHEQADVYGSGALIEAFEQSIASMFGKPAALFLPSGTMAQPLALKMWAESKRTPYVAMHHTSHLQLHEHNAYQILYGLQGVSLGDAHRVPTLADLQQAALNPLAAVLLELPMREIGGQLPPWEDLVEQSEWLHSQGIARHLDGARIWQCPAAYDRSLADIASLFDSLYVSFYKDLGGIAGACLLGDAEFIAQAKLWQRRAGGNLFALYPYVIAAREGLKKHLPQMPQRRLQAQWLAAQLNELSFVSTWPRTPHTNMFRCRVQAEPSRFLKAASVWMQQQNVAILTPPYEVGEDYLLCELTIGDAFSCLTEQEWLVAIEQFKHFMAAEGVN